MKRLTELAGRNELKEFEDVWIEVLAEDTSDVDGLLEAISALESQGHTQKAFSLLQLLLDSYVQSGDDDRALSVLRRLATLSPRNQSLRPSYLAVLRRKFADHEGLEELVRHSGIESSMDVGKAAELLESYLSFRPGAYVEHPAGWGVGVVASVDAESATVTIDFDDLKGHELEMEMATSITRHLEPDDFRARKFDRLHELKELAEKDPVELVKCVVRSRSRATTVRDLRHVLTEGVIEPKDWSKWWSKTRTKAKRDANIKLSTGANATVEVTAIEQDFEDQTLANVASLKELPKKIKYVRELFQELEAHPETKPALVTAAGVLARAATSDKAKPGAKLSVALMLERVADIADDFDIPETLTLEYQLRDPQHVVDVLGGVPIAADRKDILGRLKAMNESWPELFEKAMYLGESDVCDVGLKELTAVGAFDRLTRVIFDLLNRFREHRSSFLWFAKASLKGSIEKPLPEPGLSSLLEKTLLLHSHVTNLFLQTNDADFRKEMRTIEKLLTAKSSDFVRRTVRECLISEAIDFYNIVRGSRSLPDDVKDTVVAALLRTRPEIARERAAAAEKEAPFIDERVIYVTARGYRRFEAEYQKLVNVDIPKNAQEIGAAASYGDLSENAEWSAAIEKQSALTQKAEEMREAMEKARVIDESIVTDEAVAVGCEVGLTNLESDARETFTLLGPWDVDMERGIISYLSPLGRALLGKTVKDEVEVTLPGGTSRYRIDRLVISPQLQREQEVG